MAIINTDPKVLFFALLCGLIPSLFWLWFWLKEEEHPEPKILLTAVFIMGMIGVVVVLPIQKFIQASFASENIHLILWAAAEEIVKFLAVLIIVYKTTAIDEPVDWPIYMVTAALGFATPENTLFLLKPFALNEATVALLTGQLRFLGSTLLHTVSSAILGISIGISLHMNAWRRKWYILMGFVVAIALHTAFNFFIIQNEGKDFLKVFAFLWVATIVVMLLFEKVRRLSEE